MGGGSTQHKMSDDSLRVLAPRKYNPLNGTCQFSHGNFPTMRFQDESNLVAKTVSDNFAHYTEVNGMLTN